MKPTNETKAKFNPSFKTIRRERPSVRPYDATTSYGSQGNRDSWQPFRSIPGTEYRTKTANLWEHSYDKSNALPSLEGEDE